MKYLKRYQVHNINETIISENIDKYNRLLKDDFLDEIESICMELEDHYPTSIDFSSPELRKRVASEIEPRKNIDYPSIRISEKRWRMIYSFQEESKEWTRMILEVARKIKDYLGDNYIMFGYYDHKMYYRDLSDEFMEKMHRWDYKLRMSRVEIVFDPKDYLKES